MHGTILYSILSGNSAYADALGEDPQAGGIKLYPSVARQGTTLPYATYTLISVVAEQDKDALGFVTYRVQLDHFSGSQAQLETLRSLAVSALNRFRGVVAGNKVNSIRWESGGGDGFDDGTEIRRIMSEFSIKTQPG